MDSKITRRELATVVAASTALLAQQPPAPLPQNPEEELTAARDQLRQSSALLAKFDLPMATEPAATFKA